MLNFAEVVSEKECKVFAYALDLPYLFEVGTSEPVIVVSFREQPLRILCRDSPDAREGVDLVLNYCCCCSLHELGPTVLAYDGFR